MADPIPDPSAIQDSFQQLQRSVMELGKTLGIVGGMARTFLRDATDLAKFFSDLSPEAQRAGVAATELLRKTFDTGQALSKLKEQMREQEVAFEKRKELLSRFGDAVKSLSSDFDITTMKVSEFSKRIVGGTLSYKEFADQLLQSTGKFRYGFVSVFAEFGKGMERMDINVRKATIGMMGLGEGRVRGAQGLGGQEFGLRQYQATEDLRLAASQAMISMMFMGKSTEQAASDIMSMTQVFGGATRLIGTTLHFVSMEAALVATAFAKAANVSEQTSRAATIHLTQRLGMSAQQASSTLMSFDREAKKAGMGTELYTSWVTELSQATVNYTKDIHFSQAVVGKFAKELQSGVLSVQQFAQMTGAMRSADFGRQAGILALAQQFGVKMPGMRPGMGPLESIGLVGQKDMQANLLQLQVGVLRKLAAQVAPGAEPGSLRAMGAVRLAMPEFPALKQLQNLNNDILEKVLKNTINMTDLQKQIAAVEPPDPTVQMNNLISVAENINLSTQTLADAIQTTILGNAFRVFTIQIGPKEQEQMELMKKQREFQQRQQKEMSDVKRMESLAARGTPEQQVEAKKFLSERTERLQVQKKEQDVREQGLRTMNVPGAEAHRLAALEALGKSGDPLAMKQAQDEINKAITKSFEAKASTRYREQVEEKFPTFPMEEEMTVPLAPTTPSPALKEDRAKKKTLAPVKKMAQGGSGVVTQPTLFLAGEDGPERFDFTALLKTPLAQTPRPQQQPVGAGAMPSRSMAPQPDSGSNVNVDVKVGLTGDDKEGLIRRTVEEVEKALRRDNVLGRGH